MTNISEWSTTAASNNSASPDGFPEGMAPSGVNDSAREVMAAARTWYEDAEWRDLGHTVTYATTTTFTIATDLTATYHAGRSIRCADASTLYGHIVSSSYGAPNTTVTVKLISGNLSASLTAVALGPVRVNSSEGPGCVPVGSIISWIPGYFADGSNGTFTAVLPTANTEEAANTYLNPLGYYVCDGSALNDSDSPIFDGPSRYLPDLSDDRFLMGDTTAGGIGGASTMAHTHDMQSHTHTGPSHNHQTYNFLNGGTTGQVWDSGGNAQDITVTLRTAGIHLAAYNSGSVQVLSVDAYTANGGTGVTGAPSNNTSEAASNTENRPLYLGGFFIMRVK